MILLAVISSVKTFAFKNYPCAMADNPAQSRFTLGAFGKLRIGHILKMLKTMAAAFTFVFVCWHIFLACSPKRFLYLFYNAFLIVAFTAQPGEFFNQPLLLACQLSRDLDIHPH